MVKRLGGFRVEAEFSVEAARVLALFGPSGAGKTTLVNMVAGLLSPDQGRISLGQATLFDASRGIDLPPEKRRVGCVFQDARLFPHMSVRDNLVYGQRFTPRRERWADFGQIVEMLGVGHLLDKRPARLSGGEKQRVALGRALLASPRLLLLDEPMASMDQERKQEVLPFIASATRRFELPVLYVSHAADEIIRLADSVVLLERGRVAGVMDGQEFQKRDSCP